MTVPFSVRDVEIVRHPSARRVKLAIDPTSGRIRLTIPKNASAEKAMAWAADHEAWIARQRATLPQARPFVNEAEIPFEDETLTIKWQEGASRLVRREEDRLILSGAPETIGRRVEGWLKRQALCRLERDTADFARRAGVSVDKVTVGDARGRWGSCNSGGAIRYNWRLIMAPTAVRRATAAHEVAHRVHMNHSPAFHALVAQLYGSDPTPQRQWLRANGAALHWYGRSSGG